MARRAPSIQNIIATTPDARPLIDSVVRLDPTIENDASGLFATLDDERIYAAGYNSGPTERPHDAKNMRTSTRATVHDLTLGPHHPDYRIAYTVRLMANNELGAAGTMIGTSSLGNVLLDDEQTHLGWTAYDPQ